MTEPDKTGHVHTYHTPVHIIVSAILYMLQYTKSISFIVFLMECCIYDEIYLLSDKIWSNFICSYIAIDKTGFLWSGHNYSMIVHIISTRIP